MNAAQKTLAIAYLRDVVVPDLVDECEAWRDAGVKHDDDVALLRAMRAAVRALRKVKVRK